MQSAASEEGARTVRDPAPKVRLLAWTKDPFALAVASARTCYAADFVFMGRLDKKGERQRVSLQDALPGRAAELEELGSPGTRHERRIALVEALGGAAPPETKAALALFADLARQRATSDAALAKGIYEAGHHTPFQHPTFVFGIENVSRNVVESFLHNHTFYNSEQQSQRYVEMGDAEVFVPGSIAKDPRRRAVYEGAIRQAWDAYHDLRERLIERTERTMAAIGKVKGQTDKEVHKEAEKKAQEWARYVIPVAAHTQLYHTVSGIVLLRYRRMANASAVGEEARLLVDAMMKEVAAADARFLESVEETPHPWDELPESDGGHEKAPTLATGHLHSQLLRATPDAEALVREALAEVTGNPGGLEAILDPGQNAVWGDTLNTWDHSPALRTLRHVHYTFRKRLSLSAFAQDQRHRMTPASRPLLTRALDAPDTYVPELVAGEPSARAVYDAAIRALWHAIAALRSVGVPDADLTYLLPNATNITFTQSGDLLSWVHKWRLRLCFNAQKEIFDASLEELRAVQAIHPVLTGFIGPPCSFLAARQPPQLQGSVDACCPEGPRWCGVKVWLNFDAHTGKPKRPY